MAEQTSDPAIKTDGKHSFEYTHGDGATVKTHYFDGYIIAVIDAPHWHAVTNVRQDAFDAACATHGLAAVLRHLATAPGIERHRIFSTARGTI